MSTPPPPQHPYGDPSGDPHGTPYGEPPAQPPYPYEQQPYPQEGAGYGYPAQDPYGSGQPQQPYGEQGYGGQAYGGQAPYGDPYGEQAPAPYGEQPYAGPDAYGNWPQTPQPGYGTPEQAPRPAPYGTPYGTPEAPAPAQEAPGPQAQAQQQPSAQPPAPGPSVPQPPSSPGAEPSYGSAYDSLYGPGATPGAAAAAVPAFGDSAPEPPRTSKRKLFLGIGAGVVVLAVAGAVFATRGGGGGSDPDAGFPQVHQRLVPPAALLDGSYTRDQDLSRNEGAKINTQARGARDVHDASAVVVTYVGKPEDGGGGSLVVSGFNGRIREPGDTRAAMLKGAAGAKGAKLLAPAKSFGGGATSKTGVSCQTMSTTQGSVTVVFPMCAWADDNTAATVAEITPKSVAAKAADIDLAAAAKRVAQVRADMTKPYCPGDKGEC
ncbi:hypothetical protein [Streptomyces sp. SID11385]|uniref:hypothetical protein n=1 Tax=Streptomyces sp. SID11385 TaxID=2706031 RepID=UPI0013C99DCA|nr:hypothetical protein [Streptomyces sp. SID11385]NEA42205.1 hypothetical protein [Streptomyces sp. SID11385]